MLFLNKKDNSGKRSKTIPATNKKITVLIGIINGLLRYSMYLTKEANKNEPPMTKQAVCKNCEKMIVESVKPRAIWPKLSLYAKL